MSATITQLRRRDYSVVPWRNGGGITAEIAVAPAGATFATGFLWRLSCAEVTASGPFSLFPGYDRILVQLAGAPMRLAPLEEGLVGSLERSEGQDTVLRHWEPHAFAGELPLQGIVTEPARDFNCIVRRGAFTADVCSLVLGPESLQVPLSAVTAIYAAEGHVSCHLGPDHTARTVSLQTDDTALISAAPSSARLNLHAATPHARILLVSLHPSR